MRRRRFLFGADQESGACIGLDKATKTGIIGELKRQEPA